MTAPPSMNEFHLSARAANSIIPPPGFQHALVAFSNAYHPAANPSGIVVLGIAENALVSPLLTTFFNKNFNLTTHDLTYGTGPSGSSALQTALADFLNTSINTHPSLTLHRENIHISAGASAVLDQLAYSICAPGEGILLSRPFYSGFARDLEVRAEVKPVYVDIETTNPVSGDADTIVAAYEAALSAAEKNGTKVRAVLVCNPHNPLGIAYPRETVVKLLQMAERRGLHYISDEIYMHSKYGEPDTVFGSVYEMELGGMREMVHVVYGMSKDFGANGFRLGCVASHNKGVLMACGTVGMFGWPSAAAEKCWLALLNDKPFLESYLAKVREELFRGWKMMQTWLTERGIPYVGKEQKGGYGFFLWCDFGKWLDGKGARGGEGRLTEYMLDAGVYLATGETFGGPDGWYRITFSVAEEVMELGLERLEKALRNAEEGRGKSNGVKADGEVLEKGVDGLRVG